MEKSLKIFRTLAIITFILALLKVFFKPEILNGKGSLVDYLFSLSPLLLYYEYYRKSKKWKGQFIEWCENSLAFKTRDHDKTIIAYASIKNVEIKLDLVLIKLKSGKLYHISLDDYTEYEDRIKIKENFGKMEVSQ